jgi:hypothetical protein
MLNRPETSEIGILGWAIIGDYAVSSNSLSVRIGDMLNRPKTSNSLPEVVRGILYPTSNCFSSSRLEMIPPSTPITPSVEEFKISEHHESIIDLRYYQIGPGAHFRKFQTVISRSSLDLQSHNFAQSQRAILDTFCQIFSEIKFAVLEKTRWRLKTSKNHFA